MKNQINSNNDENSINLNEPKLKEEKAETSFIDTILNFFKSDDKENNKTKIKETNIKGGYIKCPCPKTHSKYYCDNIYEIAQYIPIKFKLF